MIWKSNCASDGRTKPVTSFFKVPSWRYYVGALSNSTRQQKISLTIKKILKKINQWKRQWKYCFYATILKSTSSYDNALYDLQSSMCHCQKDLGNDCSLCWWFPWQTSNCRAPITSTHWSIFQLIAEARTMKRIFKPIREHRSFVEAVIGVKINRLLSILQPVRVVFCHHNKKNRIGWEFYLKLHFLPAFTI